MFLWQDPEEPSVIPLAGLFLPVAFAASLFVATKPRFPPDLSSYFLFLLPGLLPKLSLFPGCECHLTHWSSEPGQRVVPPFSRWFHTASSVSSKMSSKSPSHFDTSLLFSALKKRLSIPHQSIKKCSFLCTFQRHHGRIHMIVHVCLLPLPFALLFRQGQ